MSDNIVWPRLGFAGAPNDPSGRAPLEANPAADQSGANVYSQGVPASGFRAFSITPLTLQVNNIALAQTPSTSGNLTLTAGTGATATTIQYQGNTISVIDICGAQYDRGIQVVGASGTVSVTLTVTGYDQYFQKTTMTITGPTGATTVYGGKALRYIQSIAVSGGTTANISVGTADIFGFPIAVFTWDQLINSFFNQVGITSSTGFTAADTTSPATSSTGPVRGMYQLQSSASNGTRLYTAYIHESNTNANNMNTAYGVVPA